MTFIGVMTFSTIGSSMTIYYNEYLGAGMTGLLLIISSTISFLVGIWAGHFTDLQGRRRTMILGMIASAFGAALATFANSPVLFNPWLTFIGLVFSSFGFGFFNAGASAMMVDITTPADRKIVFSLNYWTLNVGVAVGSGLSGWLFRDHLFLLLLLVFVSDLINLLIVALLIEETFDPRLHVEHQETNIIKAYIQVSKDKTFMLYLLATLFVTMLFQQMDYFIPVHLSNNFKTSSLFGLEIYGQRMLTIMAILNTCMVVLLLSTVRKSTQHWSNKRGFVFGAGLMGVGFAIVCFGDSMIWEIIGAILNVSGELIFVPFEQSLRADMMDPEQVGVYTGAFTAIQPMAQIICGLLVTLSPLYGHIGMGIILLVVTILAIIPAVSAITRYEKRLTI
ncbi:multidrug resistance protein [Lactococcus fujiensis JCM 16395]|uniref:Multidrug resistance protein n=2 Tax=Lactococcus fujiensis TaxID=610251 RepID=A0A2A5RKH2_9LACT|nr:multidrug resistance protein [Lactococcus fujiensis JCM 16395]